MVYLTMVEEPESTLNAEVRLGELAQKLGQLKNHQITHAEVERILELEGRQIFRELFKLENAEGKP
jgi:hypothetical protein